jgi:hypothetical protein
MVPPDEFIPLAEQTGVIGPLTELVIRKALRQSAEWSARGVVLSMAVNVSATNLLEHGWTDGVLAALDEHGVRPDRFIVEITEDVLMTDPDRSLTALAALSAAGVRVSLDDFGTGYSSLSYLKRLPVDELKIDRSFVFEMGTDQADAAIVQTAIDAPARHQRRRRGRRGRRHAAPPDRLRRRDRAGLPHRPADAGRRARGLAGRGRVRGLARRRRRRRACAARGRPPRGPARCRWWRRGLRPA